jgi:hypothetical protein
MANTPSATAGSATADPALTGDDDEALLQAMRNLWPLLGANGRRQAIETANSIRTRTVTQLSLYGEA